MATYYVATTASGSGDGSQGDPFSLAQVDGFGAFGDVMLFEPGTYQTSETVTVARRVSWQAIDPENTTIRAVAPFVGTYLFQAGNESASLDGFVLECDSLCAGGSFLSAFLTRCELRNVVNNWGVRVGKMSRTRLTKLDSTQHAVASTQGVDSILLEAPANGAGRYGFSSTGLKSNCVVRGGIRGANSQCINTIVIGASVSAFGVSSQTKSPLINCIAVDCDAFQQLSLSGFTVIGCMEFGSATPAADAPDDFISQPNSPFVDAANLDLRLTEAAKAAPYADRLKSIMASLHYVPGITIDSIDDLYGGGGTFVTPFGTGGITG